MVSEDICKQSLLPGRMTGSASIDTLERVDVEKKYGHHHKMLVSRDFHPCVASELAANRGDIVRTIYKEHGWLYAIDENQNEGFIPATYCEPLQSNGEDTPNKAYQRTKSVPDIRNRLALIGNHSNDDKQRLLDDMCLDLHSHAQHRSTGVLPRVVLPTSQPIGSLRLPKRFIAKSLQSICNRSRPPHSSPPRQTLAAQTNSHVDNATSGRDRLCEHRLPIITTDNAAHCISRYAVEPETSSERTPARPELFERRACGRYTVLFAFRAQNENDISVERGEFVAVLNREDTDWFWVRRSDSAEGFVPSTYLSYAERTAGITGGL